MNAGNPQDWVVSPTAQSDYVSYLDSGLGGGVQNPGTIGNTNDSEMATIHTLDSFGAFNILASNGLDVGGGDSGRRMIWVTSITASVVIFDE